jgi:large subunit ribosomal protein L23
MRADYVIKGALLSEKAVALSASKVYALKVDLKATKDDIRHALKVVFDVDAVDINTSIERGKMRRKMRSKKSGAVTVKQPNMKKAFVRLKDGQELPSPSLSADAEAVKA